MADTAISGLPDGGLVQTADAIAVTRAASNFRVTVAALARLNAVNTAQITDNAVTFAKMQDISTDTFIGRDTAGTGDPEEVTAAQARAILNVQDGATDDTTIDDHIADTTAAHAASAVSFAPTGTIAATNTQTAVAEVATDAAADTVAAIAGAPLISSEDELAGQMQIAVVATLPGSPDANTLYFVTT